MPEQMVSYQHQGGGSARFRQYKKDPLPPWAVDVHDELDCSISSHIFWKVFEAMQDAEELGEGSVWHKAAKAALLAWNTRPDSKPEKDCKSFCKLFSEAKLRDDFYLEKCRLCKESPDSKPYKWANEYEWMNAHLTMYKGDNASDCMLSAFNAGRERKEK